MSPKSKYSPPAKKRKNKRPASFPAPAAPLKCASAPTGEHKLPSADVAGEVAVKHADLPREMRRVGVVSGIVLAVMAILWLLVR